MNMYGIKYSKPIVTLLQDTGLGVPELAARTCYDSFENSENQVIKEVNYQLDSGMSQDHFDESYKDDVNGIENSELLHQLAWTHFHHCYSADTECLTREGWKLIKDIKVNESVITLNPKTQIIEYNNVLNTFEYDINEPMIHFEGSQIDLMVTSNHKVYTNKLTTIKGRKKNNFILQDASDLLEVNHCHMKTANYKTTDSINLDLDFIKLIGFFIGDGTIGSINTINFHLKKERKINFLKSLKNFKIRDGKDSIYSLTPSNEEQKIFEKCYNSNNEKKIPLDISIMSILELEALLQGLLESDGGIKNKDLFSYSTTSIELMDQIQYLGLLLGYSMNILPNNWNSNKNKNWKNCTTLHFSKKHKYVELNRLKKEVKKIKYKGKVFCIEVPNHIIYVRRNGKAIFSGNSILEHTNLSFLVKGTSRACYSDDTEVLTREGWKLFKSLIGNEKFLTRNNNGTTSWQEATDYISYKYSGEMHNYKANSIDLLVTPNHRMMFKRNKDDTRKNKEAIHYLKSEDINFSRIRMLKTINYNGSGFNLEIPSYVYNKKLSNGKYKEKTISFNYNDKISMLKFLASYISDGYTRYDSKEGKYIIVISTPFIKKQNLIVEWCKKLGLYAGIKEKEVVIYNRPLGKFLKKLGKSYQKSIPFDIFNLTKEEANVFIDAYLMFNGSLNSSAGQGSLYTSSKQLSDDLYNISLIAGYSPNLHIVDNVGKDIIINGTKTKVNHLAYQVGISLIGFQNIEPTVYIEPNKKTKFNRNIEDYSGMVYCVSVPNTNLYVRREGTGNAVWCGNCLQEHARHRIQAISVRSTRYTMAGIINAFTASHKSLPGKAKQFFVNKIVGFNMFVLEDLDYQKLEAGIIYDRLQLQLQKIGTKYNNIAVAKSSLPFLIESLTDEELFQKLEKGKKKRNVGDAFKHIISDNVKVDMVVTFNLRSLKNYFTLRDSGAAFFQIQWLAEEMKKATPKKYLDLIIKSQSQKDKDKFIKEEKQKVQGTLEEKARLYDKLMEEV